MGWDNTWKRRWGEGGEKEEKRKKRKKRRKEKRKKKKKGGGGVFFDSRKPTATGVECKDVAVGDIWERWNSGKAKM